MLYNDKWVCSSQVNDLKSYTEWLNTTFIENYFSQNYFGVKNHNMITEIRPYLQDLLNYRVGPARLRQVRIKSRKSFKKGYYCDK